MDSRDLLELDPARQAEVTAHLRGCESCNAERRAARALWEASMTPTPSPRPELFAETMRLATGTVPRVESAAPRGPSFWLGAGVGGALAASVVLAVMSFTITPPVVEQGDATPAITIALNQPRDVGVAIDAAEALRNAEIRVVLTGGVRLAGFSNQSVVSWRTDLDQGVNRLTLPVVAVDSSGGQVLVEVEHGSKRQVFLVRVGVEGTREGVVTAGPAQHEVVA